MEIKTIEDLKTVLNLLAEGKAYYSEPLYEGVLLLNYNKEKGYIEEYRERNNPYSGETHQQTEKRTVEELLETYASQPESWRYFGVP